MDTRLSSSYQHLLVCLHHYYKHLSECEICIHSLKKDINEICGDVAYLKGEVKAAEIVYLKMCEEILNVKIGVKT